MESRTLLEIFHKNGTDKHINGYTPMYHALFKNIRDKHMKILEIGIGTLIKGVPSSMVNFGEKWYKSGASLRSWKEYFPNAEIYGIDIQKDTQFEEDRIKTFLVDSTNKEKVDEFVNEEKLTCDIIIDDGWHVPHAQLKTLRNFFPILNDGGYYIIEDICPGSTLLTKCREEIKKITGNSQFFVTERKNFLIISKE